MRAVGSFAADGYAVRPGLASGDVVAMRGLTVHASKRAVRPGHRRVLHVDFSTCDLSAPLEWAMTESFG